MERRGATFAYFSATNSTEGSSTSKTNVTTVTVDGTTFTLTNDGEWTKTKLNYPGGIAIMRAVATAKLGEDSTTDNAYNFKYNLSLTGNSKVTGLKWHLYELDEKTQGTLDTSLGDKFGIDSCELVVDNSTQNETHLYYAKDSQDCSAKNLGIETQLGSYEIASGTFGEKSLSKDTKENSTISDLASFERTIEKVNSSTGAKKYYYLVVEYPNDTKNNQADTDAGEDINIELKLVDNSVKVELAAGE